MTDEHTGFFAQLKPGDEFIVRFRDGSEHIAHILDTPQEPGEILKIRGVVDVREGVLPGARVIPVNDDGTVTISGPVAHLPPLED